MEIRSAERPGRSTLRGRSNSQGSNAHVGSGGCRPGSSRVSGSPFGGMLSLAGSCCLFHNSRPKIMSALWRRV